MRQLTAAEAVALQPGPCVQVHWDAATTETVLADTATAGWRADSDRLASWCLPGRVELALSQAASSVVDCRARGSAIDVSYFFSRMAIPRLATWLGLGWLQASAVAVDGHALLVIGPSVSGKSATAAVLVAIGASLLSDHGVALSVGDDGRLRALAGSLDHQLCADAVPSGMDLSELALVRAGVKRFRVESARQEHMPLPIGGVIAPQYLPRANQSELQPVHGRDRLRLLMEQARAIAPPTFPGAFLQLAARVPVHTLSRPAIPMAPRLLESLSALLAPKLGELTRGLE